MRTTLMTRTDLGCQIRYVIWLLPAASAYMNPVSTLAQDTLYITSDEPSCPECRITFERILKLGDRRGDGIIPGYPAGATRDGDGNFWLTFVSGGGVPSVFDATGRFVRTIGAEGGGPGEFTGGGLINLSNSSTDSVYVFDAGNMRVSVYARPDRRPVRMSPVRGQWGGWFLVLEDGTMVVNTYSALPQFVGSPLHVYGVDGEHVRSFGAEGVFQLSRQGRILMRRHLSRSASPARFWSLSTSYVVELWDTTGTKHRTLIRRADWFTPYTEFRSPSPDRRPQPVPAYIHQDSSGLLWIGIVVGDPDWAKALGPGRRDLKEEYRILNENQYRDTRIEVIDPENGTLVTWATTDALANFMIGSDYLIGKNDEFQDDPAIHVWQMRLHKPRN